MVKSSLAETRGLRHSVNYDLSFPAGLIHNIPMSNIPDTKCPTCQRKGQWLAQPHAPFCSERCKLVDLGKWFAGEHVIASPLRPDMFDEYEELPPNIDPDKPETNG